MWTYELSSLFNIYVLLVQQQQSMLQKQQSNNPSSIQ